MSTFTEHHNLIKPEEDDFFEVSHQNGNMDIIDEALHELSESVDETKKSVSDGKKLVADAITAKGVTTATDATFSTMATNISTIQTGVDTSGATASTSDILTGKTAGVKGAIITGTMPNNGAVSQSLGINGTYTIPAGYHNGSGKVTQNIPYKDAITYTPGDVAQTIAAGQYLNGVQTISAVPTETKTVTAGTSATTVNRTSGKYMTSVVVNPTPSQTKSVTLTSSPLTISPDAGYLLSGVTISANLGRKYASGSATHSLHGFGYTLTLYYSTNSEDASTVPMITINSGFVPSIVKISFKGISNVEYTYVATIRAEAKYILYEGIYGGSTTSFFSYLKNNYSMPEQILTGNTLYMPGYNKLTTSTEAITWEAWE